jgi:MoxR-like ATPase
MRRMKSAHGDKVTLDQPVAAPEQVHVFDQCEIDAIDAAIAARRPLLVRGEPGIGKSQLARAAAVDLGRAYVQHVVDARTESRDLLWHFDAVARLADAQLRGALRDAQGEGCTDLRQNLAVENYLHPRVLWWAFNWKSAKKQADKVRLPEPPQLPGCDPNNGCVVLIDEIDKAETDVPNGLLEALGAGRFTLQGMTEPIEATGDEPPLVIITTNEERALPDAFIRRCLVLHLRLPDKDDGLIAHLVKRAEAHFGGADPNLLREAAELLIQDRRKAKEEHWLPLPGQAEYLDLVRAVINLASDPDQQRALLDKVKCYVLKKHPGAAT